MDRLGMELRDLIEKRVSMDRYRPVEMLAFGAIALTAGAVIAFFLGVRI
jgi:hypothetical protein